MKLYNSLTRKVEIFEPLNPPKVGMYTCGPTVYDYATIGNWRTYVLGDTLLRTLRYLNYDVDYIMNITDVGHLTGDNLGDADVGEDRLEQAAKRERKSAWDVAEFYTNKFIDEFAKLNLVKPRLFTKATDHIREQIQLVQKIEGAGFAYKTSDGMYFDVGKYGELGEYGKLSTLDEIKEGARVEPNPEKKDPRDFALWKFSYPYGRSFDSAQDDDAARRHMEWDSPWGKGFPGWHIECSAMSMKYLGEQFDIHVGGEDLRSTHHPNEIVQSEAATGRKPFVKYWVHGAFLLVDGGRMGKSLGNAYTLQDVEKKGFAPLDLRYFYLTGHYRKQLNFTWDGLEGARSARLALGEKAAQWRNPKIGCAEFEEKFSSAIQADFNMPQALAVMWELVKSDYPPSAKLASLLRFDRVLGLRLEDIRYSRLDIRDISDEVWRLVEEREKLRQEEKWAEADKLRKKILEQGYKIEDTPEGPKVRKS